MTSNSNIALLLAVLLVLLLSLLEIALYSFVVYTQDISLTGHAVKLYPLPREDENVWHIPSDWLKAVLRFNDITALRN